MTLRPRLTGFIYSSALINDSDTLNQTLTVAPTMLQMGAHPFLSGTVLATLVLVAIKVVLTIHRANALRKVMPPGPPGLPLLGNLFELPKSGQHEYVLELSRRWGTSMFVYLGSRHVDR